ncbi:hypothetical protein QBC41DRAFT_29383 [Cercophora samala]|uniref:Pentatricopeptide repeat-containing protein-mitochondrial domain-containing protein n=1 Tax=Cercophora samala TaxID=330535 RepID=A0AA39ZJK9_9PEZI|nr:hypothetical protein QBC41DRAFT_29383 [Cercophora samala]
MAAPRQVVDGLWRCLCPSIDAALLQKAPRIRPVVPRRFTSTAAAAHQQDGSSPELLTSNLSPSQQQQSVIDSETQPTQNTKKKRPGKNQRLWQHEKANRKLLKEQYQNEVSPPPITTTTTQQIPTSQEPPTPTPSFDLLTSPDTTIPDSLLTPLPTPTLLLTLNLLVNSHSKHARRFTGLKIRSLVHHLVHVRNQPPNELLYRALVVANWDPARGSAWELEDILREMDKANIAPSKEFWRAAIKLLAIHPDYTLRNLILRRIGVVYGEELIREVREDVILGLLRERQEELALEGLEEVVAWEKEEEGGQGEGGKRRWMSGTGWDTVVYVLGKRGYTEEAWEVLMMRVGLESRRGGKGGREGRLDGVPMEVWYFMLEECSRESYLEGTKYLWGRLVESGLVVPSDGMLNNILNTGARHCDEELATGAFRELAGRGIKMTGLHYEALVDCYADQGKLEEALEVASIKAESYPGLKEESRSILRLLMREPEMANRVFEILAEFKEKGRKVPASGPVALLEFVGLQGDMQAMVEALERVQPLMEGSDWGLGYLCKHAKTAEDWNLIAEAYPRIGPAVTVGKPLLVLDDMVRNLAADREGDLDLAFARLWDMGEHLVQRIVKYPTDDMLMALLDRCYWEKDSRIWAVIDLAREKGIQVDESDMEKLGTIPKPEVKQEILATDTSTREL